MSSPPPDVAAAFGADPSRLRRLAGGQDRTWYDGDVVLKPADNPVEHSWVCDVFSVWDGSCGVLVPEPIRAPNGSWVYAGWAAHRFIAGRDATMHQDSGLIRTASEVFHDEVHPLQPPAFLDTRTDAWSAGDRVAWEGAEPTGDAQTVDQIDRLRAAFRPVRAAAQIIHGDIGGNVLATGAGPAVIDWPPYYRPVGFALAVAASDAVRWEGLPVAFLDEWADSAEWYELVARALVFRLATAGIRELAGLVTASPQERAAATEPVIAHVLARLGR